MTLQVETYSNDLNATFYDAIEMRKFAESAGLAGCYDVETMERYVRPDKRRGKVLEVGAGYGRVVRRLVRSDYRKVFAIERGRTALELARDLRSEIRRGKLKVYRQDVRQFESSERFDVILWMFSGISDFSPAEQVEVLANLSRHLAEGGKLIVDVPNKKTNATRVEGRTQLIEIEGLPTYYGTVPSDADLLGYADRLGFRNVRRVSYRPLPENPERDRLLWVLSELEGLRPERR